MDCPNCGAQTKVVNTISYGWEVYRRRLCQTCNHRFETVEKIFVDKNKTTAKMRYKRKKAQRCYEKQKQSITRGEESNA